jgi:hypothetical protein
MHSIGIKSTNWADFERVGIAMTAIPTLLSTIPYSLNYFPNLALSSSTTLSSNFLNSGPG